MRNPLSRAFRALENFNFRLWTAGGLVSNIGTWMQRVAQDWIVLTQLTHHNATAVGIVTGLQFAPQLLLLPWSGLAADRFNQRKLLMLTQASMGVLATALGILTISGYVRLWHVYVFAFVFGAAAALDAPVRQTFVGELVGDEHLPNAVALNSTSFVVAQMIGPAVAGLVIAKIGTGWAFLLNGLSFGAVLLSMYLLRVQELRTNARASRRSGGFIEGLRYVWARPDLRSIVIMLFLIGTFGFNFPIFISTMAVNVFHTDARGFGLLSSIMAIGTMSGALLAAGRDKPIWDAAPRRRILWNWLYDCCVLSWILVVRCGPRGDRSGRPHLHERDEQYDAAFDQAHHARPGDGDSCGSGARGNSDGGSHPRLGCESFRPAMVARHRRDFRIPRSPCRSPDDGETCGPGSRRRWLDCRSPAWPSIVQEQNHLTPPETMFIGVVLHVGYKP